MESGERLIKVLARLRKEYPNAHGTVLKYDSPLQLLIATILSAQSTDETINKITPKLFKKYETAEDFIKADKEELERLIYSSGYYRNKAKWIQEVCRKILEDYDSEVPKDMKELTKLDGVGRKTANIILSDAFGIDQGIVVDTHVLRLSKRLGFSEEDYREKMERELMDLVPQNRWYEYSTLLIFYGREICEAENPKCSKCNISNLCPSAFTFD